MSLKGQAKIDYQREYMRLRRGSNTGLTKGLTRRKRRDQMTPEELGITGHDADGYPLYD